MNDFYAYSHFLVFLISFLIALLLFFSDIRSKVNRLISFATLLLSLWALSYGFWVMETSNPQRALFLARLLNFWPIFIPAFIYHWVSLLLNKKDNFRIIVLSYLLSCLISLFSFSSLFIKGTAVMSNFPFWPQAGPLFLFFLFFYWFPIFVYACYCLYQEIKIPLEISRSQALVIFIGLLFSFLGGSSNYLRMFGIDLIPSYFSILTLSFSVFLGHAIIRHGFLDIKIVIRRSTVYFFSAILVISLVMLLSFLVENNFRHKNLVYFADSLVLVFAMILFNPIKDYFYKVSNKYFFTSTYNSSLLLENISRILRENIEKQEVYGGIELELRKAFHFRKFGVMLRQSNSKKYKVDFSSGFKLGRRKVFDINKFVNSNFFLGLNTVVLEDLKDYSRNFPQKIRKSAVRLSALFKKYDVALITFLKSKDEIIGVLVLGPKETGEIYNSTDVKVLENVASQLAMTLENIQLYDSLKKFNVRLGGMVEKRTEELDLLNKKLNSSNAKLVQLDKAKTEFLSIASHQLRTPLSSIKGFIYLLLNGTYGKVNQDVSKALNKIYISNERLITLVEDLLNISRMESGKMVFNFKKDSLIDLANEVIDSMELAIEDAGLKLDVKFPKRLKQIKFDRGKVREVISNFLDNAIKYTPEGKIIISIKKIEDKVRLTVKDTGIGISKEDAKKIFGRFKRGTGGKTINMEGVGLGLFVCEKNIKAHKGKIWAESAGKGKGSSFHFELPVN